MKKRFGFIFLMAVVAVAAIIIFQVYWVYYSYRTGERNFNKTASIALQTSVDAYLLQQSSLPSSLKYKIPTLTVIMNTSAGPNTLPPGTSPKNQPRFSAKIQSVSVSPNDLPLVRVMMARLLSPEKDEPIRLDLLTKIYRKELSRNNINSSFRFILFKDHAQIPKDKIAAYVAFSKKPAVIEAVLNDRDILLLKQNIIPTAVSLILTLLSAGSLWYMGIIIRRQMNLDYVKNDFITNITHELRTPISILKSTHEALYHFGQSADREKTARYLQINFDILDKLDHNVDRIMEIAQYERGAMLAKFESVSLVELMNEVVRRFSTNEKADIQGQCEWPLDEVLTDRFIIDTIMSNLIDNAIKYADRNVAITINFTPLKKGWQLQVGDNGNGIRDQYLPLIFDKFYRVPAGNLHDVKGYGLGLSYVKQLVTTLQGTIEVKSKVNQGTIFTIQFPVI